jgi:hypothetical protein
MYQLGVELGQPRLAGIVEDEHGIDHRGVLFGLLFGCLHWTWHAGGGVKV